MELFSCMPSESKEASYFEILIVGWDNGLKWLKSNLIFFS